MKKIITKCLLGAFLITGIGVTLNLTGVVKPVAVHAENYSYSNNNYNTFHYVVQTPFGGNANVRTNAGINNPIIDSIPCNTVLQYHERANGSDGYVWYKVSGENAHQKGQIITGWMRSDLIKRVNLGPMH